MISIPKPQQKNLYQREKQSKTKSKQQEEKTSDSNK